MRATRTMRAIARASARAFPCCAEYLSVVIALELSSAIFAKKLLFVLYYLFGFFAARRTYKL